MDARALLRLQMEWGADEALEEAPIDRLRPTAPPRRVAPPDRPAMHPAQPEGVRPSADAAATLAALRAATLAALRAAIAAFDGCALRATASNLVFADGDPGSGLLIVGDAPSSDEDRSGRAFDGPAGAYLERMLGSIGLNRGNVLLTPLIPWRPPGGRPPSPAEIAACLPFLHRLIVLAGPRRMVLLGGLAARTLLGTAPRKRTPTWAAATVPGRPAPLPALVVPGPEQLLSKPAGRREAWAALRLLRRSLDDDRASMTGSIER
jgi:DNA polymerase